MLFKSRVRKWNALIGKKKYKSIMENDAYSFFSQCKKASKLVYRLPSLCIILNQFSPLIPSPKANANRSLPRKGPAFEMENFGWRTKHQIACHNPIESGKKTWLTIIASLITSKAPSMEESEKKPLVKVDHQGHSNRLIWWDYLWQQIEGLYALQRT